MTEEGYVKNISGELCEVVVRRQTACGDNCANCSGACRMQFQTVMAKNILSAKPGDRVSIEMDNKKVYISAFLVYILPLALFITAYAVLENILASTIIKIALSLLCAAVSVMPAIIYDRTNKEDFLPIVIKILENREEV